MFDPFNVIILCLFILLNGLDPRSTKIQVTHKEK